MKIRIVLTCFSLAFLAFVFSSSSGGRAAAANSGNTGAPGESTTCVTCHGGSSFTTSLSIQIYTQGTTTPITNYVPGTTYDMEVMISSTGSPAGYGFQMVALNGSNINAGSWTNAGSNTQIASAGTRSYVEHGGGISASNTFTTRWVAPSSGTGNVTFYSSGNAVNGTGSTAGDGASLNSVTVSEMVANVSAGTASNVSISDIGNIGNGTDVQVSFNAAANENTIGQYRIMMVKQANAASFNLAAAQAVAIGSYSTVFPNGSSTYSPNLSPLAKDVNGANITNGQTYVTYILSVADGTNANTNSLSSASNSLTLQGVAGMAMAVTINDVGNPGAPDLNVTFNKATTESTVAGYRVMLIESSNAAAFNLAAAQAVASANYAMVSPNGSANYTAAFTASSTDVAGNTLANGTTYVAFVLSIADGTNAVSNTLSSGSSPLQLQTIASVAANVTALDTNEIGTGEDILVYFEAGTDETTISEYRIMMVKSANASGFDLAGANGVAASNYTAVSPSGNANYSTTLSATATDVDGDAIIINTAYQAFVLSVADGTIAGTATLSTPSSDLTLNDPVSTEFQENLVTVLTVFNKQLYINIDGNYMNNDLQLTIFDVSGRVIKNQNINETENRINLNNTSNGIYWVVIRSGNQLWKRSVLISE
jgi:hypothetical protein